MIKPQEMRALQKDVLDCYEEVILMGTRYPQGMADQIFNHNITSRLRQLVEVANNIERASYNRDMEGR